jgi:GNAT superfamily N-acetyltransferase
MHDCLLTRSHDRASFSSGSVQLDNYLKTGALQNSRKGLVTVWVLAHLDNPNTILGFYTLSAASFSVSDLAQNEASALPRYPIPCILLGRLAVSVNHQGQGIGRKLLGSAILRSQAVREYIGAYALIVQAKDHAAKAFYEHCGFIAFVSDPLRLYFPLQNK